MEAILATKQYMTQVFDDESKKVSPCTILSAATCVVAGIRTEEKDGYNAIILGLGRKNKSSKSEAGKFKELGYVPQYVREYRVKSIEGLSVGDKVNVGSIEGSVQLRAISKGKGFQGVVKRWGFAGGPKTHGQSDRVRAPGSIGCRTYPGRVWKGKKMPGRMGGDNVVINSEVLRVDKENGYLVVKGSVPGGRNSLVLVTKK